MKLSSPPTALSPSVQRLICSVGVAEPRDELAISPEGLLCWDNIAILLPSIENIGDYFEQVLRALAPVFTQCEHVIDNTTRSRILSNLLPHLEWTNCPELFTECIEMLKEEGQCPAQGILVLLLVSAALERALGNVYLSQGTQCPSMLKDLLVTPELAGILGSTVVETLRVVIGPPNSLNLRNVAWHGFLADGELPRRYCCFLVILTASIGERLSQSGIVGSTIPHRPYVTWADTATLQLLTGEGPLTEASLQSVLQILVSSMLAQPQTVEQWRLAFHLYTAGRYGFSLALILPLLEHCFRRLFATLSGCPERLLTAESSTLYTTFNEMLEQTLPDGKVNQLPVFLGAPYMDLILDLLFYPEGPRVRDHLSHGEVDARKVSQSVVDTFIAVTIFLAGQVSRHFAGGALLEEDHQLKEVITAVNSYRSQFHPVAILQKKLRQFLTSLKAADGGVYLNSDLEMLTSDMTMSDWSESNHLLMKAHDAVLTLGKCDQWDKLGIAVKDVWSSFASQCDALHHHVQEHIPTLFRWQFDTQSASPGVMRESEFAGLLLRITEECSTAVEQVQQAVDLRQRQYAEKTLRSRQRENLRKLLYCVPSLQMLLFTVAVSLTWNLQLLHTFASLGPEHCRLLQRHLKRLLQHCENVRTCTSAERKKWMEAVDLLLGLLPKMQQFFTKWTATLS